MSIMSQRWLIQEINLKPVRVESSPDLSLNSYQDYPGVSPCGGHPLTKRKVFILEGLLSPQGRLGIDI